MFRPVDPKRSLPELEEEILAKWDRRRTFEKSLKHRADAPLYSFYDGPPFATGLPHHGHLLASTSKDIVPRYWTMRGYRVPRRWGWDTHGLPIENKVEKRLGYATKKEIEANIGAFNAEARKMVLEFASEWKKTIRRIGRWIEFDDSYKTMDVEFMESVWWGFKTLYEKDLVYHDRRISLFCPHCSTPLSNFEIAMDNSYHDDKDPSVFVRFRLKGDQSTSFLVWTTTPWTLPANVALAVGKDITYVKVKLGDEVFILAKDRLGILGEEGVEMLGEIVGADLVGSEYVPIFPCEIDGYRVQEAAFVTTQDGTGIVHIAPAYGEDDFMLRAQKKLPIIENVDDEGCFTEGPWKGQNVWEANFAIVKHLKETGFLLRKENIVHSYPHCYRCDTKLIYKAQSAWFVAVSRIRERLLEENRNIQWHPEHLREGRFAKGLETAPDWNISRSRYWGNPLPIWQCEKCSERRVVGSIAEIADRFGNPNSVYLVRHGEGEQNIARILNSAEEKDRYGLTSRGIQDVEKLAVSLREQGIDAIFHSPLRRARETADLLSQAFGIPMKEDDRLRETDFGFFHGRSEDELHDAYPSISDRIPPDKERRVEGLEEVRARLASFLDDLNRDYRAKRVVIVSHADQLRILRGLMKEMPLEESVLGWYPGTGTCRMAFSKNVDIHRPHIDEVTLECGKCHGVMRRVPDVFDCWVESGSMPFASIHYPFENRESFDAGYPAQFISEYIAQTRGWFYTLHVLSVGLFGKPSFVNAVTTGTLAGDDGRKMSKSFGNYTDPGVLIDKYGADAFRFYLMQSSLMEGENLIFSDRDLAGVAHGMLRMLWNSYSFFVTYAIIDEWKPNEEDGVSPNVLDRWILVRLDELTADMNRHMERYEIAKAARLLPRFIDDLSNWYVRRGRKRFWKSENDSDKRHAYRTLYRVLTDVSKIIAPFMPFIAEEIYTNLTQEESVHLADYPVASKATGDEDLIARMRDVRETVTEGLMIRSKAKIKVRQPLRSATIPQEFGEDFRDILKEELNVREIKTDASIGKRIELDMEIDEDLLLEGVAREIIRVIQEMRKSAGFDIENRIKVGYEGAQDVFSAHGEMISREVLATELVSGTLENPDIEKTFVLEGRNLRLSLRR